MFALSISKRQTFPFSNPAKNFLLLRYSTEWTGESSFNLQISLKFSFFICQNLTNLSLLPDTKKLPQGEKQTEKIILE